MIKNFFLEKYVFQYSVFKITLGSISLEYVFFRYCRVVRYILRTRYCVDIGKGRMLLDELSANENDKNYCLI